MVNTILLSALSFVASVKNDIIASFRNERGQDLVEYAVLVGGIAIALFAAFLVFPLDFDGFISGIQNCINFSSGQCP